MTECKKCNKQYIGEKKKRTLRERFSEHRQATNNPLHTNAAAAVPSHFNLPLLQTWVLSHLNYNLHPAHPAGKHEKLTSYIEVKQYHRTE